MINCINRSSLSTSHLSSAMELQHQLLHAIHRLHFQYIEDKQRNRKNDRDYPCFGRAARVSWKFFKYFCKLLRNTSVKMIKQDFQNSGKTFFYLIVRLMHIEYILFSFGKSNKDAISLNCVISNCDIWSGTNYLVYIKSNQIDVNSDWIPIF